MRGAARIPYCGTCKTLGVRYGQRSRILLNHDTVFLAELLIHYEGSPEWEPAYRSFHCLAKPREIPEILDYAAAITVVLAHYRVADHCEDFGRWYWRALRRFLSPQFRRAAVQLRASGFPVDELDAVLRTQRARELNPRSLADLAEPTAMATAMVFAHRRAELYDVGYRFGYLIYVLDAFEDRAKDAQRGSFNALERFPEIDGRAEILKTLDEIALPAEFHARLRANVEERLGVRPRVLCCVSRKSLRERWQDALGFARRMQDRERIGALVFAAAVAIALVFPHHARGSISSRDCLTIPFNLMALGAVFAKNSTKKGCCSDSCPNCCCDCCCDSCGEACTDCCCENCCDACSC